MCFTMPERREVVFRIMEKLSTGDEVDFLLHVALIFCLSQEKDNKTSL